MQMDDLGVPLFKETSMCIHILHISQKIDTMVLWLRLVNVFHDDFTGRTRVQFWILGKSKWGTTQKRPDARHGAAPYLAKLTCISNFTMVSSGYIYGL